MTPSLTVLYVTGWCRSGSTIIGNILGEVPGVFHSGELHFLWTNAAGRGSNNRCGCGAELPRCPVWSQILPIGRPAGMSADQYAAVVAARQRACARTRHTLRVLRQGLSSPGIRAHAELMTRVYHAVADQTGARVIVDSTKIMGEAALLPHLAGVVPRYLHLVRDPRAVAQSWSRQKDYAYVMPAWTSTAYWSGFNLAAEAISRRHPDRSMLLRYEDFIADPATVTSSLLRFCGACDAAPPVTGRTVDLHVNHTVTGNPDRFLTGPTEIRPHDDQWRAGLPRRAKLATLALSWPLFSRYGYRYRATNHHESR
jgi:hypothetical protein